MNPLIIFRVSNRWILVDESKKKFVIERRCQEIWEIKQSVQHSALEATVSCYELQRSIISCEAISLNCNIQQLSVIGLYSI